jgi:pre-mRNA-splicing factor CDC5/CEF1
MLFLQTDARHALKQGLASLPTPRNDYEIVVPENELQDSDQQSSTEEDFTPDQSDIDANRQAALKAQSNC